jgi:hypothetical protein
MKKWPIPFTIKTPSHNALFLALHSSVTVSEISPIFLRIPPIFWPYVTEYEKRVLFAQNVQSCYGLVKFARLIENALGGLYSN